MPNENNTLKFKSLKVNVHLSNCLKGKEKIIGSETIGIVLLITQTCFGREKKNTEKNLNRHYLKISS